MNDYESLRAAVLDGARKQLALAESALTQGDKKVASDLARGVLGVAMAGELAHRAARDILARCQEGEMEEFTLERSGQVPITFRGRQIACRDGERNRHAQEMSRYHDLAIYQTTRGRYLVQIQWRTRYQGEEGHDYVAVCDSLSEVAEELAGWNPLARLRGYPEGPHYVNKQARLEADVTARWAAQVSEVLAEIGASEEVE